MRSGGVVGWLVRRHVERCPLCRAERAQWKRIIAAMRATRRTEAPPGLLDGVMARIAAERAREDEAARERRAEERLLPNGRLAPLLDLSAVGAESTGIGLIVAFPVSLAFLGSLGALATALPQALGALSRAAALSRAGFELWSGHVRAALAALKGVAHALPAGVQPYVEALWWSAAGLMFAVLLIACLLRMGARFGDGM